MKTGTSLLKSCTWLAMAAIAVLAVDGGAIGGSAVGASSTPIKIGLIVPETGAQSPGSGQRIGTVQAFVDNANAHGGVHGHKLQLLVADNQSSSQGAFTAAQSLVSQGAVGVIAGDTSDEGPADQYLEQKGIPVAGDAADATGIGYTNLFSVLGASGPSVPGNLSLIDFFKSVGATKLAGVTWGDAAVAVALMQGPLNPAPQGGAKVVLQDLSPTPTTTDFASDALKVQASGATGVFPVMSLTSDVAFAEAMQQQGVHLKAVVYTGAYEASLLSNPNESALEGQYLQSWFAPVQLDVPATDAYKAVLDKYAPGTFGGFVETLAYVSADLLYQGLLGVNGNPTPSNLMSSLKKISHFTGDGLIPQPVNFTISKTAPANLEKCYWYIKVHKDQYHALSNKPVCGAIVSSTSTTTTTTGS